MDKARFAFILSQLGVLLLIAGALALFLFRRSRERDSGFRTTEAELFPLRGKRRPQRGQEKKRDFAAALTSALPTWTKGTPAHRILGLPEDARPELIEASYKALLKLYHPDRFASWGGDYPERAHGIILRLQEARQEMLKKWHGK